MRKRQATLLLLIFTLVLSLFLFTGCDKCRKGHTYDEGVYRSVCGDYGYTVYTCQKCEQLKITKDEENFTPHEYHLTYHKDADCQSVEENRYQCSVCKDRKTEYGDARGGHRFSSTYTVDIPATSSPGEKSRHCTVEGCDARTDVTELPPIEGDFPWGKV